MPHTQSPGIKFKDIILLASHFRADHKPKKFHYKLELVGLDRSVSEQEDEASSDLVCIYDFDLMYGIEDAPCEFTCTYMARYSRKNDANMTWDEFNDGMALSHVISYLREFVMNVTTRSVLPRVFLDPMNAHALVKRYKARCAESAQDAPAEQGTSSD